MNPFSGVIKQLRPACNLLIIQPARSDSPIEGLERPQRVDHLSARCEIRFTGFLQDLNRQRVIWINEDHHINSELVRT
jgi:hypothetical protein